MKPIVAVSGGTDSALALFLVCEYVLKNKLENEVQIKPTHGFDNTRKVAYSPAAADRVIEYMRKRFPTVNIHKTHHFEYNNVTQNKHDYHRLEFNKLRKDFGWDQKIIYGGTKQPEHFDSPSKNDVRKGSEYEDPYMDLLRPYDKKWVAKMYYEKELEDIFPYTVSCIADFKTPCKKCWWCKEKYWAFNAYDGENI